MTDEEPFAVRQLDAWFEDMNTLWHELETDEGRAHLEDAISHVKQARDAEREENND